MPMTAVDLFCCIGGASLGYERAGFSMVGAADNDEQALESHRYNFPNCSSANIDLHEAKAIDLMNLWGLADYPVAVFGSAPCQGFSVEGKRDPSDARRDLYLKQVLIAIGLQPQVGSFENVMGITMGEARGSLDTAIQVLNAAGYMTAEWTLLAADFGVAQMRRRHFLVFWRKDLQRPVEPEPKYEPFEYQTVRDALKLCPADTWDATVHSAAVKERFAALLPRQKDKISRCIRLAWDEPAPTLTAGSRHSSPYTKMTGNKKEKVGGGAHTPRRFIHPVHPRLLSVNETRRLQGLPDDFALAKPKYLALRYIGEGVCPSVAEAVGKSLIQIVKKT